MSNGFDIESKDPTDWQELWVTGETPWHQLQVEDALKTHFAGWAPARILVPLCGKTLDLKWLAEQRHEVVGADLSEVALERFLTEHGLVAMKRREGDFNVYRADNITLYQGDFFGLTPAQVGRFDAVYDRAALVALPPPLRPAYVAKVKELLKTQVSRPFQILQLTFERNPPDGQGPPFAICESDLSEVYGADFVIEKMETRKLREPPGANVRVIYRMQRRFGR